MRTGKRKRLAALLLCLCMMVGMLPLSGTASAADLQGTQGNEQAQEEAQPAKAAQAEEKQQTAKTITAVDALEGDAARQTAPVGTGRSGLSLPDKLTGTVDGKEGTSFPVTWGCEAFDGNTPGEYTFTAILGEAYTTAENVTLPTVTVAVEAKKAPLKLRGAANDNDLYEINNDVDWSGLQTWLDNTAEQGAVVRIKAASSNAREIKVPNENITIEGAVPTGTAGTLRLTSTKAVTLTIKDLKMSFGANGIDLASGSTLKFEGENILTPTGIDNNSAAIHVLKGDMLTLTGIGASPSLTVTATSAGAGIGGMGKADNGEAAGTVNITGGKVTVNAAYGAGIGGGFGRITAGGAGGTVNILGPSTEVDITMTGSGAGIGGGSSDATGGDGGSTTITDSKVTVNATYGAGIGGGSGVTKGGDGGTVKISNASTVVDINVTNFGAGIGGAGSNVNGGAGGDVTITGGKVTINAMHGAGIGGGHGNGFDGASGMGGMGGTVDISGASTEVDITMAGNGYGAGIGGGGSDGTGGAGGSATITDSTVMIKAIRSAGIGGGFGTTNGGAGGNATISSGKVTINAILGAGIGGGGSDGTGGAGGNATITGGKVTINAADGAGIGGGFGRITAGGAGGTVNISGASMTVDITMTDDGYGAGIGGGGSASTGGAGADVTITDGTVTIKATYGTGIGSGYGNTSNGTGGTLIIDSTGTNRAVLNLKDAGTNAVLDHSIGTCQIKDATEALTGYYSRLTVTDGTASSKDTQKGYWKPEIFKSGSEVKLTADTPPQGKYFSKWTADPALDFADADAASTTFTMPQVAQAVTANYEQEAIPVDTPKNMTKGYETASTGDASVLWPWVLLMLTALAGGGALIIVRKRGGRKNRRKGE